MNINVFLDQKIAGDYDAYYQSEFGLKIDEIEKAIIAELIDEIAQSPLLDVGCGTGHWTSFFEQKGFKVIGTDISEAMLSIAKTKNLKANFVLSNAESLPFKNESFELVTTITMLEFVDDQKIIIDEFWRLLKPGGFLLIGGLNEQSILGKNKASDPVFKNANLLNAERFEKQFGAFKLLKKKAGVYLSDQFEILNNSPESQVVEPVFLAYLFQKI